MGDWQTERVRAADSGDANRVAQAMNTVLAQEHAAAAAIDACQAEVAAALARGRVAARARVERAEALAQAIHARTERTAAMRAAAVLEAATTTSPAARPLAAVVDEIAAWLVGGEHG